MFDTATKDRIIAYLDRNWVRLTIIAWAVIALYLVIDRLNYILWLTLGDTDDNMRLMQVRGLLNGQGWYDLRNYRLDPPIGFNIHWSRLVDLPIAGLILLLRPLIGNARAEQWACGLAPLIPMLPAMLGLNFTVRQLVSKHAWPLAVMLFMGCAVTLLMFMPDRIDHHGWQLAMLSLTVAGLCDPKGPRGGMIVGVASAVSLTIGLEMLPYSVMAGAIVALRWVIDREDSKRLATYALSLGGGTALGYALFASYDNRVARCDALTPVYLTVMVVAGALLFLAARLNPRAPWQRLALAALAGAITATLFALVFPQCLGRPEQVSPELATNWLNNIREAKPIYQHPFRVGFPIAALPFMGALGAWLATWRARRTPAVSGWLPVALFSTFAFAMLFWQVRAGPAAQMLAVPGAAALIWLLVPWCLNHRSATVRVFGTVFGVLLASGVFAGLAIKFLPIDRPDARTSQVNRAGALCMTIPALRPLNRLPAQTIFTLNDIGPRLITVTHHNAIAGPYHRNGDAILDVQHAFTGTPEQFRAIAQRHGATLLLICPNIAESTLYRSRNPDGFYGQLAHGDTWDWLEPIGMPAKSPYRLFRIKYESSSAAHR